MKYTYIIRFANGKFYQSRHQGYVSISYREVDNEIDATVMEEGDLRYLISEKELPSFTRVQVCLGELYVGEVLLEDIEAAMN